MWLVLCDPDDDAALWAYIALHHRGLAPLELISPQTLVWSWRSAHRIDQHGAHFEIALPDGRTLRSRDINGALNRVTYAPLADMDLAANSDARYAREELAALLLSWLSCIEGVVINRPTARGLAGTWRLAVEWVTLATKSGLPVPVMPLAPGAIPTPPRYATTRTVVVFDDQVFGGDLVPELSLACRRLARLADTQLLGIYLHFDTVHRPYFGGATPLPDLRIGGDALIEALHRNLTSLQASGT